MSFQEFNKDITAFRRPPGAYVGGRWIEGEPTQFTVQGSVQPLNARETQLLPEGRREQSAYKIYTGTELRTVEENESNPDWVIINGVQHEILKVYPYQSGVIPHYKAIAVKRLHPSLITLTQIGTDTLSITDGGTTALSTFVSDVGTDGLVATDAGPLGIAIAGDDVAAAADAGGLGD